MSVVQKQIRNPSSYSQIRYLMKRFTSALDKRLKEGRPSKYCRLCRAEIRPLFREEKEKLHQVKEYRPVKNQNIRRMTKKDSGDRDHLDEIVAMKLKKIKTDSQGTN